MALDEFLLTKNQPVLRFYGWEPAAVSIGYFQSIEAEVDLDKCEEFGIDVVRRQTGGGAVLHDDEVTYSIHIPVDAKMVPEKILDSYEFICQGVIRGLAGLGLEAKFVPLNDIIVGGQKISGNAQTRRGGMILQHGTILKGVDVDKMFDLLKVPDEKMKGKLIEQIKDRVTAIDRHADGELLFQDIVDSLIEGFSSQFEGCTFISDSLTEEEIAEVETLASKKYLARDWNFQR